MKRLTIEVPDNFNPEFDLYVRDEFGDYVSAECRVVDGLPASEAVVEFAREIIAGALEGGNFDGAEIQELAHEKGLLLLYDATESCGEGCGCVEYGFPSQCYRMTALLASTDSAGGK